MLDNKYYVDEDHIGEYYGDEDHIGEYHGDESSSYDGIAEEVSEDVKNEQHDEPEGLAALFMDHNDQIEDDHPRKLFIGKDRVPVEVARKIITASSKLTDIPATGMDNSTHSRYPTHDDIMKACNPILAEVGLGIIFMGYELMSQKTIGRNAKGTPEGEVQIRSYYDVIDLDSGEAYRIAVPGVGKSYGGKAIYIATTMATNYAYKLVLKFGMASVGKGATTVKRENSLPKLPTAARIGGE